MFSASLVQLGTTRNYIAMEEKFLRFVLRKFVVADSCFLSLLLRVTTGSRCVKEERTRRGKKCSQQQLRRVDKRHRELEIYRRDRGFV